MSRLLLHLVTASLVALCTFAGLGARAAQAAGPANASFEDLADGLPASWEYIAPKDGDGSLLAGKGRDGGRCAKVSCTRLDDGWGPGFGQSGVVSVEGGKWYEVAFWARAEGLTRGAIVALRDTEDWNANRLWRHFFPGPSWREQRVRFQVTKTLPAEVSRFQFSFDSTGTLWIDDVRLTEAEPEKPANVLAVAGRKNLIPNSSFEVGDFGWATYGADELFGEVDATTAAHGEHSFRLTLEEGKLPVYYNDFTYRLRSRASHETMRKLPLCTIGYCPVEAGEPVTFSFSVKGSEEGVPVVATVVDGRGKVTLHSVDATDKWSRHSFAATPGDDIAFVTLGINAGDDLPLPVTIWVDALQLELGDEATEYVPTFPVECGLGTGREGNVYVRGETLAPEATLCNHSDAAAAISLSLQVEDFFGNTVAERDRRVTLAAGGTQAEPLDLGINEPGFYRLHLSVTGDGWQTTRSIRAAIIYPFADDHPNADGFLGINHGFISALYMRRARAMGVTWVRSWYCKWQDVEQQRGAFDFSEADLQYDWLKQHGMNVQLCLSDPSSEWASTAPEVPEGTTGGEAQTKRVWWLPKSFADYERYVRAVAEHFSGRVKHYEIFNEPLDRKAGDAGNLDLANTYPIFLRHARSAVRSVDPQSQLMGAGLHYLKDMPDLAPVVKQIDLLSEHRYPGLAPAAGMLKGFASVHDALREAGGDRPIWMTEYGLYADDDPDPTTANSRFMQHYGKDSERLAATHVAKHHLAALASGVEKVFFHIGNWPFRVNREHGCGFHAFFEWGGVPRKTYVVLNTLAHLLPPGTKHVKTWTAPNHFFAIEFDTGAARVVSMWAEGGLPLPADALDKLSGSGATFTNVAGTPLEEMPDALDDSPVYVALANARQREAMAALLDAVGASERETS